MRHRNPKGVWCLFCETQICRDIDSIKRHLLTNHDKKPTEILIDMVFLSNTEPPERFNKCVVNRANPVPTDGVEDFKEGGGRSLHCSQSGAMGLGKKR
jgi:hypothetical protein